jgi:dTMP kinase
MTGRFITFEGGEGAGKTTQIVLLAEKLRASGQTVITTREPGGTKGAEAIRALLVTGEADRWDAMTELFLLNAARRDHVQRVIRPALARGDTILCDRFIDSTRIYQGFVKGLADDIICALHAQSTGDLWPDTTLLLDLPADVGLERTTIRHGNEDRFEGEDLDFHTRLRQGFLALAARDPQRISIIDADAPVDSVAAAIWQQVNA